MKVFFQLGNNATEKLVMLQTAYEEYALKKK